MNNICSICHAVIDNQWSDIQNSVKSKIDLSNLLNNEFTQRCIFCYKAFLELALRREHEWYLNVIKIFEEKHKKC